jgi:aminoglycoside phosphotransferase (APT) family kinase protein
MPLPAVTIDEVRAVLSEISVLPDPTDVSRLPGGESGAAHLVTFADGTPPVVMKVYGSGWTLAKEVAAYRLIRRNGITLIPELIGGASARDSPIGRPYLIMTRLRGESAEEITPSASDHDVSEIYRQMGSWLRRIHGIQRSGFGYQLSTTAKTDLRNEVFMRRVFDERAAVYADQTGDRETADAAAAYVADRTELFAMCRNPVLLHGDFHEGNVIVDLSQNEPVLTGVIDLENAMTGDPIADFARLDTFSIRGSEVKQRALFEGYGSVPAEWDARRRLYQLVQAFELWVWYEQDGHHDYLPEVVNDIRDLLSRG